MVLAYTTPNFAQPIKIAYAFVTNILLMTLYSANNMPYSALGGVMTGDPLERAKLNSFRFISVNIAQLLVVALTLPLVF
jgi:Na+/melibiose symporter-like transporter